jgi:hypothetical protein
MESPSRTPLDTPPPLRQAPQDPSAVPTPSYPPSQMTSAMTS